MVRLILDSSTGGYPVLIGTNLQRELRNVVTRLDPTSAAIVTDSNVRPYAVKVAKAIKRAGLKTSIHAIPAGERSKSVAQLQDVLSFLERQHIDRGGCVIAVGGGTVGDLAGLAASIWTRDVFKAMEAARTLNFGHVQVNDHLMVTSEMPHGGFKQSGFGKDMSMYAIEHYTELKHVMVKW